MLSRVGAVAGVGLFVNPTEPHKFTDLEQRFIEEYPVDCNAAQAVIRAGYDVTSAATARYLGYELKHKPHIWAAIQERLEQLAMKADEAVKHISDIAATRLNDFMVVREVQSYLQEEQYVTVLITHARNEIKSIEAFIGRNKLKDQQRYPFDSQITVLLGKILEYEQLVERYGDDVTLLVPGRPVVGYQTDLDLVALARAKEQGRIKKFKHTKEGIEIEMLDAQSALRDVLKLHGRFVNKVDVTTDGESLNAANAARAALLSKLAEGAE